MSVLTNKGIFEKKQINSNRTNDELLLNDNKNVNSLNNIDIKNKEKNQQEKFSFYKKVCVKPFTQIKPNKKGNINIHNKIITTKEKNNIKQYKNFDNKINLTNNDLSIKLGLKANLEINDSSLNFINSELSKDKSSEKNNKVHHEKENCLSNNFSPIGKKNKFLEKNNIINTSNNFIKLYNENNQNSTINEQDKNDLNLELFDKDREKVNINYINTISNNVYGKINSPIYLNKIISLPNDLNDNLELFDSMNDAATISSNTKRRINKKLKKKILLNDTNQNTDMNKTNGEIKPNFNYFNNITEINPVSKIEEIEINSFSKKNNQENNIGKKLNYFENKKRILSSIEREKKKLLEQNYKNYIKYINLIRKQQEQYKEYDQYLKSELQKNRNSQIKLELFKENYFNIAKDNMKLRNEFKTLSSQNFKNNKIKNKLKINRIAPLNKVELNNKFRLIDKYETSIITDNSISTIRLSKNGKPTKYNQDNYKKIIKINFDELKRRHTINFVKKNNKKINLRNLIHNNNPNNKNVSNISHLIINSKQLNTLDGSFNKEISNQNKKVNKEKCNKTNIFSDKKNIKTDFREFDKSKKKFVIKDEQKCLILKKLVKKIKNELDKKNDLNKNIFYDINIKKHLKCNSMKKIEEINEYYYETNKNSKNNNKNQIHKLIYEEKKKFLNNLSEKKPNYIKLKNGIYFSASKPK